MTVKAADAAAYRVAAADLAAYQVGALDRLASLPALRGVVLAQAPGGYWRCDEAAGGAVNDATGTAAPGTLSGGTVQGAGTGLPGDPNSRALQFDGSTGFAQVPGNAAMAFTGPFSCGAWVNPTTLNHAGGGSNATPFEKLGSLTTNANWRMWCGATGIVNFRINGISTTDLGTGAGLVPLLAWTHLGATWDGTVQRIYVNGVLQATSAARTGAPLASATTALAIGKSLSVVTRNWNGLVKDLFCCAGALPAGRWLDIVNAGRTPLGASCGAADVAA